LSLLIIGMVPAMAVVNPQSGTSSTSVSSSQTTQTTTSATNTQSSKGAQELIQLAQTAQSYAQQVLAVAQSDGANVTKGQGLIAQGNSLLSTAESVLSTNPTQAAKDALGAMNDFKEAAQSLQTQVVISIDISNQVHNLSLQIERLQNRTTLLQTKVTSLCSGSSVPTTVCADANTNLSQAKSDLTSAASQLAAVTSSSTEAQIKAIQSLLSDASNCLQKVAADINTLANDQKDQKAVTEVQNVLLPEVSQLQSMVQKANLTSAQQSQLNGQLSQAKTLLNTAIQSFQGGDFSSGVQQVNQAEQLMVQVFHELAQDITH